MVGSQSSFALKGRYISTQLHIRLDALTEADAVREDERQASLGSITAVVLCSGSESSARVREDVSFGEHDS